MRDFSPQPVGFSCSGFKGNSLRSRLNATFPAVYVCVSRAWWTLIFLEISVEEARLMAFRRLTHCKNVFVAKYCQQHCVHGLRGRSWETAGFARNVKKEIFVDRMGMLAYSQALCFMAALSVLLNLLTIVCFSCSARNLTAKTLVTMTLVAANALFALPLLAAPVVGESQIACSVQAAVVLFGILLQQVISVGLAYVRFLILVKKQKVTVPWAIRFIILAVLSSLAVTGIPIGIFNNETNLLSIRPSYAFCSLDWRAHSAAQLFFLIPSELLFVTALFWIPYGYSRICNVVTATFSQLDLSQSHVIQTNESGVFQPELSRRESVQHSARGQGATTRRQSMLLGSITTPAVTVAGDSSGANAFGSTTKENFPSLQRRRSISNAGYTGGPLIDRRRRMSAQISATIQLPEVKEMREGGASLKRNSALLHSSPARLLKMDFSVSKESIITIDKVHVSQRSLHPLRTERSHQTISKSRDLQSPAENAPDQHRDTESQSAYARESTLEVETSTAAKSFKSLNQSMVSVAESFTRSGLKSPAKSLVSIAQEASFSQSGILPPIPAQVTSPGASLAGLGSLGPSLARSSMNPTPKTRTHERPRKTSLERVKSFLSQKPSFLTDRNTEACVTENAKRQKVVWTQSFLIVLAYVLGWTPYFVLLMYETASGESAPPAFDFVSMFAIVGWGAVNPVLVWLFDPEIRSTVSKSLAAVMLARPSLSRKGGGGTRRALSLK
ncbi:hypothetical protein BJ741DRAFT_651988 [Chytriomyces cf. hyalinus JEL632]|nr:hypothetical protein BJ741DRAFT_651988 [Chytriomyces cf. hyalinus JEL632]